MKKLEVVCGYRVEFLDNSFVVLWPEDIVEITTSRSVKKETITGRLMSVLANSNTGTHDFFVDASEKYHTNPVTIMGTHVEDITVIERGCYGKIQS